MPEFPDDAPVQKQHYHQQLLVITENKSPLAI
jgi:hypothetical protein